MSHLKMAPSPPPRPVLIVGLCALATLVGSCWLVTVARYEHPNWMMQLAALKIISPHVLLLLTWGAWLGATARRAHMAGSVTRALAWLCLGLLPLPLALQINWDLWLNAPDWLSSLGIILSGSIAGIAYCLAAPGSQTAPLWPLVIPFTTLGVVATVLCRTTGSILGVAVLCFLSDAVGRRALRLLQGEKYSPSANVAPFFLRASLGLGLLIAVFRLSGLVGGTGQASDLFMLAVIGFTVRRELGMGLRALLGSAREPQRTEASNGFLYGAALGLALVFWFAVLAPETGPDALGGRSALPMIWERAGAIVGVRDIALSFMGIGGEVMNLLILPLVGANVAKVSTFATALMLASTLGWLSGHRNRFFALVAGLVFFTSTTVWWHFVHGFVDLPLAFFCVAALGSLLIWQTAPAKHWIAIAGFLGGTAAAIKLNGGAFLLAATPVVVLLSWTRVNKVSALVRDCAWFATGTLVALLPPVIRSALLTGNPVFPFANGFFQSPLAETTLTARLYGAGLGRETIQLPFLTVLKPAAYTELGTYHPCAWLFALASILVIPWARTKARIAWWVAGVMWLAWILTEQNLRYSLPAWACTAAAIAVTIPHWLEESITETQNGRMGGFIRVCAGFLVFTGLAVNISRPSAWMWSNSGGPALPMRFAFGRETAAAYIRLRLPSASLAGYLNAKHGSHYVVWQMPWMRDQLYFHGRTIAHPHGDPRVLGPLRDLMPDRISGKNPASIKETLATFGIEYLVWDDANPWTKNLPETSWPGIFSTEFTRLTLTLEAADRGLRLFRVNSAESTTNQEEPFDRRAITTQQLQVEPGHLIGIEASWAAAPMEGFYLDFAWYSSSNQLVLFDRMPLLQGVSRGNRRRWQTPPEGSTLLRIYPSAPLSGIQLSLLTPKQAIRP